MKLLSLLLLPILFSCQTEKMSKIFSNVGDIEFDEKLDDKNFRICNSSVTQYFSLEKKIQYRGEKISIEEKLKKDFSQKLSEKENGYITIRFIVNCEGKTGYFRVQEMNSNYEQTNFNKDFVQEILRFTQNLDGWENWEKKDYYQYLTFKIENGKVSEILP